jgi:thioesterase domain-containing protein
LLAGGTACFFDPITRSLGSLAEWIDDARITMFQTSPSVLVAVAGELDARSRTAPSVRLAIIGGEPCEGSRLELPRRVFPRATIANHYGASEAGFIAVTRIAPGESVDPGPIPFRRVYSCQTLRIVDEHGQDVPAGVPGEIHVSGSNVALGYWGHSRPGDPQFVREHDGRRSVQLRDRARVREDGAFELLGRSDLRVKIHGQSVDLQEVERELEALPMVREAAVSAVTARNGQPRLVAHIVPAGGLRVPRRDLRLELSKRLPSFAIPTVFFGVDAIPRNARGKVDREALRESASTASLPDVEYLAPRTANETTIAGLAAEALGLTQVGVRDDIFDLGIESFTVVGFMTAINERFGASLTTADLLAAPTVESLAGKIGAERRTSDHPVVFPVYSGGSGTPFFCVSGAAGAGTFATRRLGYRLGRPTYSFAARGQGTEAIWDGSLAGAAARFVGALRDIQPAGPYLVGGLSFGALMAFEIAKQLDAGGERVALLVLVDPVTQPPGSLKRSWQRVTAERAGLVPSRGPLAARLVRRFRAILTNQYQAATAAIMRREPVAPRAALMRHQSRMARHYRPTPYAGRTLLLRTRNWQKFDRLDILRSLSGRTDHHIIAGSHMTMFGEPYLADTARIIREGLTDALADSHASPDSRG